MEILSVRLARGSLCSRREFLLMPLGECGEGDWIPPGEQANMVGNGERRAGSKGDGLCDKVVDAAEIHFTALRFCRSGEFGPPFARREFLIENRLTNGSTDRSRNFAVREPLHTLENYMLLASDMVGIS